jgi:transglutaminase-like putative cysteine protease
MDGMARFLSATAVIDADAPAVAALAAELARGCANDAAVAKSCFEWVRDRIAHSVDGRHTLVTCNASEVLREGTGLCFAKSHLLSALLRANDIPAGLCYQRLTLDDDGQRFSLHGFVGAWLKGFGWYRIDARGNRADIDAQFTPPVERLAFAPARPGEYDLPGVRAEPLPEVIRALRRHATVESLCGDLPDVES